MWIKLVLIVGLFSLLSTPSLARRPDERSPNLVDRPYLGSQEPATSLERGDGQSNPDSTLGPSGTSSARFDRRSGTFELGPTSRVGSSVANLEALPRESMLFEKRMVRHLREKRCKYIGTFFHKIDCNAPANSTRVPYAPPLVPSRLTRPGSVTTSGISRTCSPSKSRTSKKPPAATTKTTEGSKSTRDPRA
ncbi:hypothetical protein JCM10212_002243 [Sporobolomyces blumeae]